ncbi:unnamed protein product [Onchocerca ochengi]|uniref:SHNi-TPR domain-containing protein n=1 Tax=Onchocerca ochengi TaxID=42157 RepID=A0A182E0X0_ONCOC|nr:unnamed protein product [Onchocerca ochengi]
MRMMESISRNDEFVDMQEDEEDVEKFQALLAEGKQAYISERFKEAEIKLSEAAELSVNIYGYFAIPTFEPHLYYGKTLLELARLEDSVFSNTLHNIRVTDKEGCKKHNNEKYEDSEEVESFTEMELFLGLENERTQIVEKIGSAFEENAEVLEKKIACWVDSSNILEENNEASLYKYKLNFKEDEKTKTDHDADENETDLIMENDEGKEKNESNVIDHKEDRSRTGGKKEENGNMENEEKEKRDEVEDEEEKNDRLDEDKKDGFSEENDSKDGSEAGDVEYLQLAWENLEVARAICDKHLEEEGWKEKKVEVLLDLADCSTDAENYKQAIDDIDACIILTESIFDKVDRRIAQAYFIKGRTHNLAKDFGNAAKVFGKSKEILEARLTKLETQLAHESQEEVEKIKKEIDELKSLLPEIQMKIDDSLESARSLTKESVVVEDNEGEISLKSSIKEMPVDDVSNLVRKKLKRPAGNETQKKMKRTKDDDVESVKTAVGSPP